MDRAAQSEQGCPGLKIDELPLAHNNADLEIEPELERLLTRTLGRVSIAQAEQPSPDLSCKRPVSVRAS